MPSYTVKDVNEALVTIGRDLLTAPKRHSRAGETRELLGVQIVLEDPLSRVVMNPERKASLPAQIAETAWVLAGRNDVEFLSHYLPRAAQFSDDGKVWRAAYGQRIRSFGPDKVDQLQHVIKLLKEQPNTRQAVISIYDPTIDVHPGKDIPCNNWLHFIVDADGKLDLHVAIRSNDIIWGWSGINQFEWSVLLEIVACYTGHPVGRLIFSTTSLHVYKHHYDRLEKIVNVDLPPKHRLSAPFEGFLPLGVLLQEFFDLEKLIREQKTDVAALERQIDTVGDPMFREWLRVLQAYWSGTKSPELLVSSAMNHGLALSPKRKPKRYQDLLDFMDKLHVEKDAAYGDSWCRRGELFGILPNIARKVDRLGKSDSQETALDTAIDLLVYLAKYHVWRVQPTNCVGLAHTQAVGSFLALVIDGEPAQDPERTTEIIRKHFEGLLTMKENREQVPDLLLGDLVRYAILLVRYEWDVRQAELKEMKHQLWKDGNATRGWSPEQ